MLAKSFGEKKKINRLEVVLITSFHYTTEFLYLVEEKNPTTITITIDYKIIRVKIISRLLDTVKFNFLETTQFIEDCLEQMCSKENITVGEVIFLFTCLEAKS